MSNAKPSAPWDHGGRNPTNYSPLHLGGVGCGNGFEFPECRDSAESGTAKVKFGTLSAADMADTQQLKVHFG